MYQKMLFLPRFVFKFPSLESDLLHKLYYLLTMETKKFKESLKT